MTTWVFSLQTDPFYSKIKVRLDVVPFFLHTEPHTEREVYTMHTPRLRLLSAILAVALFFTLLPVSALAEGGGSTGVSHVAIRTLDTNNKDDQGLTYTLNADHTATVANYDNHTQDGVIDIPDTVISGGQPYTVTAIGYSAFGSLSTPINVSSVFIPATVLRHWRQRFHLLRRSYNGHLCREFPIEEH